MLGGQQLILLSDKLCPAATMHRSQSLDGGGAEKGLRKTRTSRNIQPLPAHFRVIVAIPGFGETFARMATTQTFICPGLSWQGKEARRGEGAVRKPVSVESGLGVWREAALCSHKSQG